MFVANERSRIVDSLVDLICLGFKGIKKWSGVEWNWSMRNTTSDEIHFINAIA